MPPNRNDGVYDKDDSQPVTRPDLKRLEEGDEAADRQQRTPASSSGNKPDRGSFGYNPAGDEDAETGDGEASAESPGFLRDAESAGTSGGGKRGGGDENFFERTRRRLKGITGNKLLVGVGLSSGLIIIIIIVVLLIFFGNYKLVQLGEHIADYRFARVSRNYADSVSQITAEDTALSTADQSALQKAADKFKGVKDGTWGSMWDKIDNYRPDKIVENFKEDGTLNFKYERGGATSLWKKKLTGVVINGEEITPANTSAWNKVIHPIQSRTAQVEFSDQFNARLAQAMQGRSSIIRGAVAKSIRDELGIKLDWWRQMTKYRGASEEKANQLIEAESEQAVSKGIDPAPSEVSQISDGAKNTQDAINQCAADEACTAQEVKNGGKLPSSALSAIDAAVNGDVFQKAINFANPTYAVALPVCLIYDGSLVNGGSGQTASDNNVSTQDQRSFYAIESAADKQKNGANVTGEAVGAMDWKAGDISKSVPEQLAAGRSVDTSDELQPQANGDGSLGTTTSIFSFLPVGGDLADSVATSACPLVTNIWFGVGVGIGTLLAGFFSGGTSEIAEQGLARALTSYLAEFVSENFTKKEAAKLGILTAGIAGVTILAKMLVAQKAGANDNGFATGPAWDNAGDRGGDLNAQEISRRMYGRPLTNAEVAQSNLSDQAYRGTQIAGKGFTERYFDPKNSSSLASHMASTLSAHLNGSAFSSLLHLGSNALNPTPSLASALGDMNKQVALADGAKDNQNYGIVQWGFSDEEESLMQNDPSYGVLENMKTVTEATYNGQPIGDYIAQKYNKCWGYGTDGQPDPSITVVSLLADGSIQRDNTGNVTGGLCSKQYLGANSADPAAYDPTTGKNDLIFRYRVMKNHELTVDNLTDFQAVTTSDTTTAPVTGTGPGGTVSGNAQQLAQQILQAAKDGKISFAVVNPANQDDDSTAEDNIKDVANGKPAHTSTSCLGGGTPAPNSTTDLNTDLLKFIVTLSQSEHFTINELAGGCHSPTSNHYKGTAVDFGCPFTTGPADAAGKQYNIFDGTGETCSNAQHYHYSIGGN